jgi:ATP-dependent DNA helicase RecQ
VRRTPARSRCLNSPSSRISSERHCKVIAAQLENAGIAQRRRGRVALLRRPENENELVELLGAYEARRGQDHERLQTMMRYAQSAMCRSRILHEYFDEVINHDCMHCDNCEAHAAGLAAPGIAMPSALPTSDAATRRTQPTSRSPRRTRSPRPAISRLSSPYEIGERVVHNEFGAGNVVEVADTHLSVQFAGEGLKRIHRRYLSRSRTISADDG